MLSSALKLLSAVQLGQAAKQATHRACVAAAVFAAVGLLFLAGGVFALVAAYLWLITIVAPPEAAGIIAAALIVTGLAVLAVRSIISHRQSAKNSPAVPHPAEAITRGAAEVTASLGPAQIVGIALLAGLAAGRSISKS